MHCTGLIHVALPSGIKEITYMMFYECVSLSEIIIPENVETIGSCSFFGTGISKIVLPTTLKYIEDRAFYGCTKLF